MAMQHGQCPIWLEFFRDRRAAVAIVVSLSIIPLIVSLGVAIDLGRALSVRTNLQTAIDAAVLSGVTVDPAARKDYAAAMFLSQTSRTDANIGAPQFLTHADRSFSGSVVAQTPMTLMKLVGRNTFDLSVRARALPEVTDESCILTLGANRTAAEESMIFNGASSLNLAGCTLRSNTSMKCNGHTGNADASYAVGSAPGCQNPWPGSLAIPDIHARLADGVSRQCGLASHDVEWSPGSPPASPQMMSFVSGGVTAYHVCGNLTLKGAGAIVGDPSSDTVLVVENGDLILDRDADVTLIRTTIVLTGAAASGVIRYPQGKGQAATLRLTPGRDPDNHWSGVGIFHDPAGAATPVSMTWGPGAALHADGVLYFGNADVTMSGNLTSNSSSCTKLVANTFVLNGAVNLKQDDAGCRDIGLTQYRQPPRLTS